MVRSTGTSRSVTALDAPRQAGRGEGIAWAVGGGLVTALVVVGLVLGDQSVGRLEPLVAGLYMTGAAACTAVAFVVYSHAVSSRNRAYLALGSTFLAAAWSAALLPSVSYGQVVTGQRLLGDAQSPAWTATLLRFLLLVGAGTTAAILWHDGRKYRRPGRTAHVGVSLAATAAVMVLATIFVLTAGDALPALTDPDGMATTAWLVVVAVTALLALGSLAVVIGLGVVRYSIVAGWLIGVALLTLAQSLVEIGRPAPESFGWLVATILSFASLMLVPALMLTHLGQVERAASRVASFDALTGIASREGLIAELIHENKRARAYGNRGALLWVDLDGFKSINDQLGHATGDLALAEVAGRLATAARPSDTVARLAGDEFGVLVVDLRPGDAEAIATRVLAIVREPLQVGHADAMLTASIGVAEFPAEGADPDELLQRADLAMYEAKNSGGDQVAVYDTSMGRVAARTAQARQELALALRDESFELHYQPMVDLVSEVPVGVEALVRWRRNGRVVAAGDFIPTAESTGQIRNVGRTVLDLLAADLARHGAELPSSFRVAVNLSVPELADPDVAATFCDGPLTPWLDRLAVEVTEGVMLSDHVRAVHHVAQLRSAGAVIALDDFGSGFANVEALASLEPEVIKVDGAFTRRAGRGDASGTAFLRAALAIGDAIGARVLAEGIETREELRIVRDLGIELGQGHLLGSPRAGLVAGEPIGV